MLGDQSVNMNFNGTRALRARVQAVANAWHCSLSEVLRRFVEKALDDVEMAHADGSPMTPPPGLPRRKQRQWRW